MAVTEVLQRVIYMVDVLWEYLFRGTFIHQRSNPMRAADT